MNIQSVRIESDQSDVTNWRIIDRTSGTDLTEQIDRVEIVLTREEGITARLHFKQAPVILLDVDGTVLALALTAMVEKTEGEHDAPNHG